MVAFLPHSPFFMNKDRPLALITNDDGIDSNFLRVLIEESAKVFETVVCAPDGERSWIGHAISRHSKLKAISKKGYPAEAYSLNGTPADCVNFAIGNILEKEPDILISGINLGYNITLPMILSSGTVGAAIEGSLLGIRSFASSMSLPEKSFDEIRSNNGKVEGEISDSLRNSAKTTVKYAYEWCNYPLKDNLEVHNLNFPFNFDGKEEPILSFAGSLKLGSLFEKVDGEDYHQLVYRPEWLKNSRPEIGSDIWILDQGKPSVSRLNFADISGRKYLEP